MKRKWECILACLLAFGAARAAFAAGADAAAEKESYLPLIAESTYTYHVTFKQFQRNEPLVVKSAAYDGVEAFYFERPSDQRDPQSIVGANTFGLGLFIKENGGISMRPCFRKNEMSLFKNQKTLPLLKNPPELGAKIEAPSADGKMKTVYTLEAFEDVTVPAGTFKACLKIKTEEIESGEKGTTVSGAVWLAKGVGVVKWQRVSGRVDELAEYKIAEVKVEK